jgi:hypothetical protein
MISNNVLNLVSDFLRTEVITAACEIGIYTETGIVLRKEPAAVQFITPSLTQYTFYLNEEEARDTTILSVKLFDINGNEIASQDLYRVKGYPESLLISWSVEII